MSVGQRKRTGQVKQCVVCEPQHFFEIYLARFDDYACYFLWSIEPVVIKGIFCKKGSIVYLILTGEYLTRVRHEMISMTSMTAYLFHRGSSNKLCELASKNPGKYHSLAQKVILVKQGRALSHWVDALWTSSPSEQLMKYKIEKYDRLLERLSAVIGRETPIINNPVQVTEGDKRNSITSAEPKLPQDLHAALLLELKNRFNS